MVAPPAKTRPRLFLIDGYALIYRAFFAMINRPLTTTKGENTSAAFGFTRFLLKILDEYGPDYLGVVLDAGTSQREIKYPDYKATRQKMPDELKASLPRIRSILTAFRVPVLELADHEADDVIGSLVQSATEAGVEAVIVSGDKDFYQLIGPGISLLNPGRGGAAGIVEEWVDTRNAAERLGVPPEHVVDYLALIGDASDNIPGARGIGPKTAVQLIDEYGSVEEILKHAAEISGKRAREALQQQADAIMLSKELVTIQDRLPIPLDLDALAVGEPDRDALREIFLELEFQSLARDLAAPEERPAEQPTHYVLVDTTAALGDVVTAARQGGRLALAVLSTEAAALRGTPLGLAVAVSPGQAYYLPLRHRRPGVLDLEGIQVRNLPPLATPDLQTLVDLLQDDRVAKVGHDLKNALLLLRRDGVTLQGLSFDTMVASYVIDPGRRDHDLDSLALQHLGQRIASRQELCGKGKDEIPLPECDLDTVRDFAAARADAALRLQDRFATDLERYALGPLFRDIEMPLLEVLADMEESGIRIDVEFFRALARKLERELHLIQQEIYKLAGEEFNINSTPQLRIILFEKLQLPVLRKTKTGPSTDAAVLEELASQGHGLPRLLLEFRQLDKLKGTYVDALPLQVDPRTGRIHTIFSQTVAATGRLSSSDPNLQNIPIRTELGAEIRKGFVPVEGAVFLSVDYSQIELRILAHLSGDPTFVEAFRKGVDIHKQTAALMFDVAIEEVTPAMRAAAKTVNFATIYGIGPYALSQQLGTSVAEARTFIEQYFARLPDVRRYLDEQIEMARERGYVTTISGRRRYIPEIRSKNYNIRQFGERAATNAPVQGSAADVIKLAMIQIHGALREGRYAARMLLQVHDELVFEAPEAEVEDVQALVVGLMEDAVALNVPLKVTPGTGHNWYECK